MHGPPVSERQGRHRHIDNAVAGGARVLTGGHAVADRAGFYVESTVSVDVSRDSAVAQAEIPGPVLCVIPYDTVDEAVHIANSTIYGLAGEVSGGTDEGALGVARRLRAGSIPVNGGNHLSVTTPLGG